METTVQPLGIDAYLASRERMCELLQLWAECGWLRRLDARFARFLADEVESASPLLLLGAALASHQLGRGHACLDLQAALADPAFVLSLPPEGAQRLDDDPLPQPSVLLRDVTLGHWQAALENSDCVASGSGTTPLVFVETRLYLRRYWQYEQSVSAAIMERLKAPFSDINHFTDDQLREVLGKLFPENVPAATDWQKMACALAARNRFSVITGGPGTGKTTTVVKLLALLQALALGREVQEGDSVRPLRIRLAAPTGKAAARLNESIAGAIAGLKMEGMAESEKIRAAIPVDVTTLHRLLGSRPDTRHFRHDKDNPLVLDVLVIDEASMIDLEMMAAVLDALPAKARLVLLGDKDQLASVEAGAVLGELCRDAGNGNYSSETTNWLKSVAEETLEAKYVRPEGNLLHQCTTMLRRSFRFDDSSGIGRLAASVNSGDAATAMKVLNAGQSAVSIVDLREHEQIRFRDLVLEGGNIGTNSRGYRYFMQQIHANKPDKNSSADAVDAWARHVLKAYGSFQMLSALRQGPTGVSGLNLRIAQLLQQEGLITSSHGWYCGRPVLVTRNDYSLGLMNGDIGIALDVPCELSKGDVMLRVAFPSGDGQDGVKWVMPSRLQDCETVFAMTVHKSQGSEFDHAVLVMPPKLNPILTRELVYTAITRARKQFTLVTTGEDSVFGKSIERRVTRSSGLQNSITRALSGMQS